MTNKEWGKWKLPSFCLFPSKSNFIYKIVHQSVNSSNSYKMFLVVLTKYSNRVNHFSIFDLQFFILWLAKLLSQVKTRYNVADQNLSSKELLALK